MGTLLDFPKIVGLATNLKSRLYLIDTLVVHAMGETQSLRNCCATVMEERPRIPLIHLINRDSTGPVVRLHLEYHSRLYDNRTPTRFRSLDPYQKLLHKSTMGLVICGPILAMG